jgi:DNA polymerase elongation subunit (family B)
MISEEYQKQLVTLHKSSVFGDMKTIPQDVKLLIEKYNISMQDINILTFSTELELINSFFATTFQTDYLIGFNSKYFDLSYFSFM